MAPVFFTMNWKRIFGAVRRHLEKWKNTYEVGGVLVASLASLWAVAISHLSLKVADETLRLQKEELAQRNERHDLVATMLKMRWMVGEKELSFDLVLINRGNQNEIVRELLSTYSDSESANNAPWIAAETNLVITPGEKKVIRIVASPPHIFTSKPVWIGVGVVAIGPDAADIQSDWKIARAELATNYQGGGFSYVTNAFDVVPIVSDKRLPHQREAQRFGF